MSRPLTRSEQWSQTTTGISQTADRLNTKSVVDCLGSWYPLRN